MIRAVDLAEPEEARCVVGINFENVLLKVVGLVRKEVESKLVVEAHRVGEGKASVYGMGYQLGVGLRVLF